jgi:predicted nucleic acid-binding protein
MILVSDAGPLHYLVLIGCVDVLRPLYDRVVIPGAVAVELQQTATPLLVRNWMAQLPDWCAVLSDPPFDRALESLGPGERSAIALAVSLHADRLLVDDRVARTEAKRRRLPIIGTLGVLAEAHKRNLIDFELAIARLQQTSFYFDAELIETVRRQLSSQADF